jgi:hypothetical protein
MALRRLNLFLIGVLFIVLYFTVPVYYEWVTRKILCEDCNMFKQARNLEVEERMSVRFGGAYDMYRSIQSTVLSSKARNPVILLPPNNYVYAMKLQQGMAVPEPAVFYYFTGIKAVYINSPECERANWALIVKNHLLYIKPLRSKHELDSMVAVYKNYVN